MLSYRSLSLFFCLTGAVCLHLPAFADATSEARAAIQSVLNARQTAYLQKDITRYLATFTPDYQVIPKSGKITGYKELRARVLRGWQSKSTTTSKYTIKQCSVQGNQATLTLSEHDEQSGRFLATKAAYKTTLDWTAEETWVRSKDGWQEKTVRTISWKQVQEE